MKISLRNIKYYRTRINDVLLFPCDPLPWPEGFKCIIQSYRVYLIV